MTVEQAAQPGSSDVEFNAADAIQALLNSKQEDSPEPDDTEPEPKPAEQSDPEPETQEDDSEPSAEIEGAVVETKAEPEKPAAVERKPAPETERKPSEPNPQDQLLAQLNVLVPQLQAAIAGEFADITSFETLQKVAAEDPQRYNRYVIHQAQLQHAQSEQQRLGADYQTRFYQAEAAKLAKELPDYADPAKGPALKAELRTYALKQGYDEQRLQRASATDVMTIHKAMLWDKAQSTKAAEPAKVEASLTKAKEKAAQAPKVQKPGVPVENEKADRAKERLQKFAKSGHTNDLASLLIESGLA